VAAKYDLEQINISLHFAAASLVIKAFEQRVQHVIGVFQLPTASMFDACTFRQ